MAMRVLIFFLSIFSAPFSALQAETVSGTASYLERIGLLGTTSDAVEQCLSALRNRDDVHHFEVETYAWNVLPKSLSVEHLADGIAQEMQWLKEQMHPLLPSRDDSSA